MHFSKVNFALRTLTHDVIWRKSRWFLSLGAAAVQTRAAFPLDANSPMMKQAAWTHHLNDGGMKTPNVAEDYIQDIAAALCTTKLQ